MVMIYACGRSVGKPRVIPAWYRKSTAGNAQRFMYICIVSVVFMYLYYGPGNHSSAVISFYEKLVYCGKGSCVPHEALLRSKYNSEKFNYKIRIC